MKGVGDKISAFTNIYFKEHGKQAKLGNLIFEDNHKLFTFYLIDKIVENFASIGELFKLSEKQGYTFLRNSIYILTRGVLSDVIIIFWLFTEDKSFADENEMILSKVNELKRDHIKFHISFMKIMSGLGLMSKEDKMFEVDIINTKFRHLLTDDLKPDLSNNVTKESTKISKMLNDTNKSNSILVEAYKNYFLLSKVEHTGEFTRMILQKTHENNNPMDDFLENSILAITNTIQIFAPEFLTDKEFIDDIRAFNIMK